TTNTSTNNNNILEQSRDNALRVIVPLLLPLCPNVGNRLLAFIFINTCAADVGELPFAHPSIQINVSSADIERSVGRDLEPRPDLPDEVEEDDERKGETVFEEDFGIGA